MPFTPRRQVRVSRRAVALLTTAALLAACASKRSDDFAYAPANFGAPDPVNTASITQEYRLGPTDVVSVEVYRAADLTGERRVDEAGNIVMPLIGPLSAQGKTTIELAADITRKLSEKYYENPVVNVAVKEAAGQRVTIDGSVNSPGVYPILGRTTLMQAVAMAKGANTNANLRKVVIFRTINGQRMAAAYDLRSIRDAQMEDPQVYGSDIIVVDGSETKQALRDAIMTVPILGLFRPLMF
jgi:polysaccharide export outer membrane protein